MSTAWTQRREPPTTSRTTTLVAGTSFAVSDGMGDMDPGRPEGLFVRDTRVISAWRLLIDEQPVEALGSESPAPFAGVFVGRARPAEGDAGAALVVERRRYVGEGMREDITLHNHGREPTALVMVLEVDADFADLFDVKAGRSRLGGDHRVEALGEELRFRVQRGELSREVRVLAPASVVGARRVAYRVAVAAQQTWATTIEVRVVVDGRELAPRFPAGQPIAYSRPARELESSRRARPVIRTGWAELATALTRSEEDLEVLRINDPEFPDVDVVAAGAPWFMTLFGRDALLASWMMLPLRSDLAFGSLRALARLQGRRVDALTDEEPGRIPHELRRGLDAGLAPGEMNVYYGTADATPLFVMLLGELRRWGHPAGEVERLLPAADRALAWVQDYGDRDGDGFVEYLRATDRGLRNQGWKDSFDSVNFVDGTLAEPPIALAEVQAYVYGAYRARAHFAAEAGDLVAVGRWAERAEQLRRAFNDRFWLADRGWFAVALDRDKRPVDALTSNIGHCLWTGIVDEDKAAVVAERLMSPDMFTGFGIRTLAASMGAYNPVSYHNGSVWPHDNAIAVAGLVRYGYVEAAQRVARGLLDASAAFGGRLPELFCGFAREDLAAPVPYPASCSPQAWAAAAPVQLLRSLLQLEPSLPHRQVWFDPVLPRGVGDLEITGLSLADHKVDLQVLDGHPSLSGLPPDVELILGARPHTAAPPEAPPPRA